MLYWGRNIISEKYILPYLGWKESLSSKEKSNGDSETRVSFILLVHVKTYKKDAFLRKKTVGLGHHF